MHKLFYLKKSEGKRHLGELSIDGRIKLKWIIKKQVVKM
jgi:hypothetical protein